MTGALSRNCTDDLLLTGQALCLLSYQGKLARRDLLSPAERTTVGLVAFSSRRNDLHARCAE